ncbi:hypothetical protein Tco_0913629 [Tanacetum coccineum]
MDKCRSYMNHNKHQVLFDPLLNSMILNNAIACGQVDPEKVLRKRDRDDEDPSAGPNQGKKTKRSRTKESEPSKKSSTSKESSKGKSPAKTSKSGKSMTAEEPIEEPVFEMASDDIEQTVDDVANDADQLPDDSTQTKDKNPKKYWFKQPPRPPTPNQEWNKVCYESTQEDNLTQAHLVGPVYELLKGTCTSNIELEYNLEDSWTGYSRLGQDTQDLNKQKRVMRADELYKFSDGTLKTIHDVHHHRLLDFRLGYNNDMPRRKWTAVDKRISGLMVDLINKQMLERRIIQNLKRLVSARELEMDYRLMTRTE